MLRVIERIKMECMDKFCDICNVELSPWYVNRDFKVMDLGCGIFRICNDCLSDMCPDRCVNKDKYDRDGDAICGKCVGYSCLEVSGV